MPRLHNVDLRLLRVFKAIVECGGLSAAQLELNVGQSTVSNHLAALESRLGYRLCLRGRQGFRLTEKGEIVYDMVRRLFMAMDEFESETGALRGELVGHLRFGILDAVSTDPKTRLHQAFRRFNQRKNAVHVELSVHSPRDLQHLVMDGRLDAALGTFPQNVAGLRFTPLYDETQRFYCAPGHPFFDRDDSDIAFEEMREMRVIARAHWTGAHMRKIPVDTPAATAFDEEAQLILIRSGSYLGYLPEHYAAPWVARGALRAVFAERLTYASTFYVITRRTRKETAVLGAFLSDLKEAYAVERRRRGRKGEADPAAARRRRIKRSRSTPG